MDYESFKLAVEQTFIKLDAILTETKLKYFPSEAYDEFCELISWIDLRDDLHELLPVEQTEFPGSKLRAQVVCYIYCISAQEFFKFGAVASAIAILIDGWNKLAEKQFDRRQRVYRAAIAHVLARLSFQLGDTGAATWWALHTQADDHLGGDNLGGAGRHMLLTVLGVPKAALETLRLFGRENLEIAESNWQLPCAFAEDVVARFAFEKPEFNYIFGNNALTAEFPISQIYYDVLIKDLLNAQGSNDNSKKGQALEKLSAYLCLLIPGWIPRQNVWDEKQVYELDLVVRNWHPGSNLMADVFGRYFIVECKNWKEAVGSRDVGFFLTKMRQAHASFGILFSNDGITGDRKDSEELAAKELTRRAYHEDKTVCVVVSMSDLMRIQEKETTFRSLLLELYEEFRFGIVRDNK